MILIQALTFMDICIQICYISSMDIETLRAQIQKRLVIYRTQLGMAKDNAALELILAKIAELESILNMMGE